MLRVNFKSQYEKMFFKNRSRTGLEVSMMT